MATTSSLPCPLGCQMPMESSLISIFQTYLDSLDVVSIDDILMYHDNVDDHDNHPSVVLQNLKISVAIF